MNIYTYVHIHINIYIDKILKPSFLYPQVRRVLLAQDGGRFPFRGHGVGGAAVAAVPGRPDCSLPQSSGVRNKAHDVTAS